MSGGIAYVWDPGGSVSAVNKELVSIELVTDRHDREELRRMIQEHVAATSSVKGRTILEDFDHAVESFKKILASGL